MAKVGGKFTLYVEGRVLEASGEWTILKSNFERTSVETHAEVNSHFTELPKTSGASGSIVVTPDLDLSWLEEIQGGTVTLELSNGWTHTLIDAYCTAGLEPNTMGQLEVTFNCPVIQSHLTNGGNS